MSERRGAQPETLRVARDYLALGWHVVPVRPGEKMPAVRWADYTTHAATVDEITHWFSVGGYGIGLVQGSTAGTIVLDFDGEDGWDTLRALEREHGELPESPRQITPGGGLHYVFRHPGRHVPTRKGILPGFDVRGDGGFIVAYPSKHPNGRPYAWDVDAHYEDVAVAECPTWVADLVCSDAPAGDVNAVVYAPRKLGLGLSEAVVVDGREQYMRNTVLAVYRELWAELGRRPTADELFERAWPQYSRKADLTRPGRGADEVRRKCEHTVSRGLAGRLPVKEPSPKVDSATANEDKIDPETGEILGLEATQLASLSLDNIQPRRWIYGRELLCAFVSAIGSTGGVGKTAFTIATAVSIVIGKSLLHAGKAEPPVFLRVHKQGPVWLYNLEDPMDEMLRRIKAALMHHGVEFDEVKHGLYIDSGRSKPLIVATRNDRGDIVATPVVEELIAELKRRQIVVLVVDPFVQSHAAEENRNDEMNKVMALWAQVAHRADCAIWLVHHFRKGGQAGEGDAFRGAGAIHGAARAMSTLSQMSKEEADKLGVPDDERKQFVRLDNAKANLAPSPSHAEWYRLVGVNLGNGNADYPDGDSVQTVEPWEPPSEWDGLPMAMIVTILDEIDAGPGDGERYAFAKQSKDRWAGKPIIDIAGKTPAQAAAILKAWKDNGLIEDGQYISPSKKTTVGCVSVNGEKRREMRSAAAGGFAAYD